MQTKKCNNCNGTGELSDGIDIAYCANCNKESVEDAAMKYVVDRYVDKSPVTSPEMFLEKKAFIAGARWAKENKY